MTSVLSGPLVKIITSMHVHCRLRLCGQPAARVALSHLCHQGFQNGEFETMLPLFCQFQIVTSLQHEHEWEGGFVCQFL